MSTFVDKQIKDAQRRFEEQAAKIAEWYSLPIEERLKTYSKSKLLKLANRKQLLYRDVKDYSTNKLIKLLVERVNDYDLPIRNDVDFESLKKRATRQKTYTPSEDEEEEEDDYDADV